MMTTKKMIAKIVSVFTSIATLASMTAFAANTNGAEYPEDQLRSMANEIAIKVNEARIENGLDPVYVVPYLNEIATERAEEAVEFFSHTRPNGEAFYSIIDTDVVDYSTTAENLAAGSDNAEDTFNQWANSPGHWANILKKNVTHIGVGVAYDENSDYGWYWTQIFVKTDTEFADQYLPTEYEIAPKAEGDITGDGVVDTFDYLELTEYITRKNTAEAIYLNQAQLETADCFQDGIITEADAKVMVRYLLGEYKSLPYVF